MNSLVGVYGTLRYGRGLHGAIRHCDLVGLGRLNDHFIMIITRMGYPAIVHVPDMYIKTIDKVLSPLVELYNVINSDTLVNLDAIEGVPTLYRRGGTDINFVGVDGSTLIRDDRTEMINTSNSLQKIYPDLNICAYSHPPTFCQVYYMNTTNKSVQGCEIVMNGDFINPDISPDHIYNYNDWSAKETG